MKGKKIKSNSWKANKSCHREKLPANVQKRVYKIPEIVFFKYFYVICFFSVFPFALQFFQEYLFFNFHHYHQHHHVKFLSFAVYCAAFLTHFLFFHLLYFYLSIFSQIQRRLFFLEKIWSFKIIHMMDHSHSVFLSLTTVRRRGTRVWEIFLQKCLTQHYINLSKCCMQRWWRWNKHVWLTYMYTQFQSYAGPSILSSIEFLLNFFISFFLNFYMPSDAQLLFIIYCYYSSQSSLLLWMLKAKRHVYSFIHCTFVLFFIIIIIIIIVWA